VPQVVCIFLSAILHDLIRSQRFDPDTPIEETVGRGNILSTYQRCLPPMIPQMHALNDVVKAGYARYIGMSSCFAWQCELPRSPTKATYSPLPVHAMQSE